MTDNEIISAWRGECRHIFNGGGYCNYCHKSDTELDWGYRDSPKQEYDLDPAAWTEELFDLIEEKGLASQFAQHFSKELRKSGGKVYDLDEAFVNIPDHDNKIYRVWLNNHQYGLWHGAKATPEQKARALARAIEEAG